MTLSVVVMVLLNYIAVVFDDLIIAKGCKLFFQSFAVETSSFIEVEYKLTSYIGDRAVPIFG